MRLNHDYVRDILLFIEQELEYNDTKTPIHHKEITHSDLISNVKLLKGGYIKGSLIPKNSGVNFDIVNISRFTLQGHDLLENIKPDPVWKETKSMLHKVGDFSLGIMSQVAGEIMVAYTKSMMNLN